MLRTVCFSALQAVGCLLSEKLIPKNVTLLNTALGTSIPTKLVSLSQFSGSYLAGSRQAGCRGFFSRVTTSRGGRKCLKA